MSKKFFTVEDLINFCESKKIYNFSSKESNEPIVVQSIQDFSKVEIEESDDGKLYAKVRVCHTLLNRNNSYISEESMLEAMPTLKYSPLLASIHQLDDGSWDFHSHDFHIEKDEDGNEYEVYDESQVGTFTADDPYLEYDKEKDKTYVIAKVAIPIEYTRTADIIESKGGTKVSCELLIYDCSYNAEKHYLQLDHFRFNGCTCLGSEKDGTPIGEGMEGSFLSLEDFSVENNSLLKYVDEKLNAMQSSIDELDARFNIEKEKTMEGGNESKMNKFEELLEKYNKTVEDITFEYSDLSDEELEVKFKEVFEDGSNDDGEPGNNSSESEPSEGEWDTSDDGKNNEGQEFEKLVRTYEISHEDVRYALYNLLASYEELDDDYYYISNVYDSYFVYEGWCTDKIYRQGYVKDGDNVSFDGERTELFRELLTASEKAKLEEMRSNYAELKAFKEEIELNELREKKKEILDSEKYEILAQKDEEGKFVNKDYEKLVSEMDNYSLTDLETEIKVLHSDYVSEHGNFALSDKEEKTVTSKKQFVNVNKKASKPSRYGKLFAKEEK
jgi:hypothetical protein|nr:MAG TPA: hypothetical protein [Caudoviricetes sp.]